MGGLEALLPSGVTKFSEAPNDLVTGIQHASTVLSWHENLSGDETPPRWMWPFADELDAHFEGVQQEREKKYSSSSGGDSGDLVENEL